jgi:outer membrane lipoprotein-sorting protein
MIVRPFCALVLACLMTTGAIAADGSPTDGKTSEANSAVNAGTSWNAEVAADGKSGLSLDETQTQIVKDIDAYFNDLGDLKGRFIQHAKGKRSMRGKFLMQRPGKFRFDYNKPSRQVIISDGKFLAIQDHDLNNEDRVELDQTPFRLLLKKEVNLLRDALITRVEQTDEKIVVGLRDKDPNAPGHIALTFSRSPALELEEWRTKDAQGVDTRVVVGNLVKDEKIDAKMFKIRPIGLMQHP